MAEVPQALSIGDLARFLAGSRSAIGKVAQSPMALVVGGIFVFTGALAREYDGVSFVHEPWVLVRPLAASIVLSSALFFIVSLAMRWGWKKEGSSDRAVSPTYLQFLRCYWMTAPMAWLYAFPAERLWDPATAVTANFLLLAFVSIWRVMLISRVISILWGARYIPVLFVVLFFCDAAVLAGTFFLGSELPVHMGGVRGSPRDEAVAGVVFAVMATTLLLLAPLLIAAAIAVGQLRPRFDGPAGTSEPVPVSRPLWGLAFASVVALGLLLPWTQPQHFRAHELDRMILAGRVEEAIDEMSRREPTDVPSFWEPAPKLRGNRKGDEVVRAVAHLETIDAPEWVVRLWAGKAASELAQRASWFTGGLIGADELRLEAFVNAHESLIDPSLLHQARYWMEWRSDYDRKRQ